jgi:hypothetical protein
MPDRLLHGLTVVFVGSFIANLLVHWIMVGRALHKAGAHWPTGLLPWRMHRELNRYREVLRAHGDSLSQYYIIVLGQWFSLILGLVVGFMWLWQMENPAP